jgi:calmodulin-lysine N-methyltransferase
MITNTKRKNTTLFQWNQYTFLHDTNTINTTPGSRRSTTTGSTNFFLYEKKKTKENCIENIQQELFSHHVNEGIDNTGNIRTWPSEQILLKYLIHYINGKCTNHTNTTRLKVCELGAGMAGLGAFGLLAYYKNHSSSIQMDMLITDGNSKAVENLQLCLQENIAQETINCCTNTVKVNLLRWDEQVFKKEKNNDFQQFDLIFASDCLFFENFHVDLLSTIATLLKSPNGKCFFLQPARGGSMERFIEKLIEKQEEFNLQVNKIDKYDEEIYQKHLEFLKQAQTLPEYRPDLHYPILLEISHRQIY